MGGTVNGSRLAIGLLCASTLLPALARPAPAQEEATPDRLAELIAENRYPLTGAHGALAGPGLDFLVEEGRASEFLLLGESHLVREIPLLAERLLAELRPAGYAVFAIETGPLTAEWMVERVEAGGVPALREVVGRLPFTVPFYDRREEGELLERALAEGYEVWGLDQEFMGSGRYWLARLAELAPSASARELVEEWSAVEQQAVRRFVETQRTDSTVFMVRGPEEFDAMREAFAGSEEARRIVDALAASARIYQLWQSANYENNRQRVAYMKGNFVDGLHRWKEGGRPPPKALLKFGSNHMGRGLSPVHQYDLGTLAQELAVVRGGRSLHVQATAVGRRGEDGGFDRWLEPDAEWGPFLEQMADGPWTLFDLRALRPWFHRSRNREANPALAKRVFQYDLLLIAPEFTGSEPLAELPGS